MATSVHVFNRTPRRSGTRMSPLEAITGKPPSLDHLRVFGCPAYAHVPARRRLKMQAHRAWQADLTTKLKLKRAAVAALPPHLRAAAEVPDNELFPLNREMWTHTPPIEGFGQGAATMQQAGAEKFGTKHRR